MIEFFCPSCKHALRHPTPGKRGVYPKCGQKVRVPAPPVVPRPVNETVPGELTSEQAGAQGKPVGVTDADLAVDEAAAQSREHPPRTRQLPHAAVPVAVPAAVPVVEVRRQPYRPLRRHRKLLLGGLVAGSACLFLVLAFVLWKLVFDRAGLTDERRYLPDGSRLLISVNVRRLLGSSAGQKFLGSSAWRKLNQEVIDEEGDDFETYVEKSTGIPLRDVSRVTIAGRLFSGDEEPVFVIKVKRWQQAEPTSAGGGSTAAPYSRLSWAPIRSAVA
jgi:hypothetical protein